MGKYFTIEECCVSGSYPKLVEIPEPGTAIYRNLEYTIERMDIIREKWGSPIIVTSGFRNRMLNEKLKGSRTSAHLVGMALDVHPKNGDIMGLAECIINSGLEFDQLILEFVSVKNKEITDCKWIHIGFSRVNPRKQILAYNGQEYKPVTVNNEIKFKL